MCDKERGLIVGLKVLNDKSEPLLSAGKIDDFAAKTKYYQTTSISLEPNQRVVGFKSRRDPTHKQGYHFDLSLTLAQQNY